MSSLTKAFKYAALCLRESFRRPPLLGAYLIFLLKGLLAGGVGMLLTAGVLALLGWSFFGSFLIGFLLCLLLIFLFYSATVLQAQLIQLYGAPYSTLPPGTFRGGLSIRQLSTFFLSFPWITKLKNGHHLLLPVLGLRTGDLEQAQRALANQVSAAPLQFEPKQVRVKLLSTLLVLLASVLGGVAAWLAATNLNIDAFLSLPKQIFILEMGLLAFLIFFLPNLGTAALLRGFYHTDLYQREFIPDLPEQASLLEQILNKEA